MNAEAIARMTQIAGLCPTCRYVTRGPRRRHADVGLRVEEHHKTIAGVKQNHGGCCPGGLPVYTVP
jgi:hypothetical protein